MTVKHWQAIIAFLVAGSVISGCATYASRINKSRQLIWAGDYDSATVDLKKYADLHDKDEILYLMELGAAYHGAKKYQQAVDTFLIASKLSQSSDYTSITAEAGSVVLNDDVKPYQPEDFERVLIHVYLAMDYTFLNKWEDAIVECRLVNRMLDKMAARGRQPYEENGFAKYLSAALFESGREYNDALVDYRAVLKWQPLFPYLPAPLLRLSERLAMGEEHASFKKQFPSVTNYRTDKDQGEVILLLEVGKSPVKVPNPAFVLVPTFRKQFYSMKYAWLRDGATGIKVRSNTLYDIESAAIRDLDRRTSGIIAKKLAGYAAKELVAAGVAKESKNEVLGALTSLLLHASDHADLRSWSTLPARLEIARMTLQKGLHDLYLDVDSRAGDYHGSKNSYTIPSIHEFKGVDLKPGEIKFLVHRLVD